MLPQVLRQAGHRGVYVTPRDEQGAPKAGWSIAWISSQKAEVARLALGTPEQAGLVRAKERFGIRVADADYHDVFCKLRPNDQPQARVAVQLLYKLCPTPAGATEQSVLQWAQGLS